MKIGRNCKISSKASFYGEDNIEIGDNVRIDDFCVLSGGSGLRIGSHIHIACYVSMFAGSGITCGDFTQYGAYTILLSESDDFSGKSLIGPTIPAEYKPFYKKGHVYIGKHVVFGSRCMVFPRVNLNEGAAIGACSMVTKDCEPWKIYAGTPAKIIGDRDKQAMLEQERAFLLHWERNKQEETA
jgi:acetyltransferase-like isoleucine patch superfamily enzyme